MSMKRWVSAQFHLANGPPYLSNAVPSEVIAEVLDGDEIHAEVGK